MEHSTNGEQSARLSPDEAFAVLGNGTRMEVLRALSDADGPLRFSELHDRVGIRDSGQFNYHLEKLVGHFVQNTDDGYELSQSGTRVIEAVLSGAVTAAPEVAPTRIDESCHYCGAPIVVHYREERVDLYCTECSGTYGGSSRREAADIPEEYGFLGGLPLPPAGVQGRTPEEVFGAAWTWGNLEILSMASGVCPRCSAAVERSVSTCEDHDATGGLCEQCDRRHAVYLTVHCTNCNFDSAGGFVLGLVAETELLSFLTDHGINPVSPDSIVRISRVHEDYDEDLLGTDPFEARFTFAVDDEALALTVDDTLNVVDTTRRRASESG